MSNTTIVTNGQIVKEIPVSPQQFQDNIRHYRADKTGPWKEVSSDIAAAYRSQVSNEAPVPTPITPTPVVKEVEKEVLVVQPINEKKLEPLQAIEPAIEVIEPSKPKKRRSKKKVAKEEIPAIKLDSLPE